MSEVMSLSTNYIIIFRIFILANLVFNVTPYVLISAPVVHIEEPCMFPAPYTKEFDVFCQLDYHKVSYMCDPQGVMSRTVVELLGETVKTFNLTSCFCTNNCMNAKARIAIAVVPNVTLSGLDACDTSLSATRSVSLPSSALKYGLLLNSHWSNHCLSDIMIVYLKVWISEKVAKPFVVTIFANEMERIQRYSIPLPVSPRLSVLSVLQQAITHANRMVDSERSEISAKIPKWAKYLGAGMVGLVILSIYIANCVTSRCGTTDIVKKHKTPVSALRKSSAFRAGFGGGMMMNTTTQQKKSVMMFRTFSKQPRNNTTNRL